MAENHALNNSYLKEIKQKKDEHTRPDKGISILKLTR